MSAGIMVHKEERWKKAKKEDKNTQEEKSWDSLPWDGKHAYKQNDPRVKKSAGVTHIDYLFLFYQVRISEGN
jgi:hypothetical protein